MNTQPHNNKYINERVLASVLKATPKVIHAHIDKYLQSIHGFDVWPWIDDMSLWHVYESHFQRLCTFSKEDLYMWCDGQYVIAKEELQWLLWLLHLRPVASKGFDAKIPAIAEAIKIAYNSRVADMDAAHKLHLTKIRKERSAYENILGQ